MELIDHIKADIAELQRQAEDGEITPQDFREKVAVLISLLRTL